MPMSGDDMATAIFEALVASNAYDPITDPADPDLAKVLVGMKAMYNAMVGYITTNMEIKGITVNTSTLLSLPTPVVPVPTDGGAAVSVQMIGNADNQTISQNNDGTGRVS